MLYLVLLGPLVAYLFYRLIINLLHQRRERRRQLLRSTPLAPGWLALLQSDFPLYRRLPADLQQKLQGHMQVFMAEKVFVGCDGFVVTDEVRLLIAAQACLLILNNGNDYYPTFESILVYPSSYAAPVQRQEGYLRSDHVDTRAGESWHRGPVVLAWDQVWRGALHERDGHNVVMHEFAHKLDEENGTGPGLPLLRSSGQYKDWARIFSAEYEQLCRHGDLVIDSYGAENAAEFFAVVTEVFFEKPQQLQQRHGDLYEQLRLYYQLDPVQW
ncbi:zinc-dependent peptidase [Pseudomaricurvus sp. HS19]|uniref:M90 family metallopeptidase n=1 Tax=Pseudomaricurvus sp. HS19 TaxID=2692626 RepID=UPI00136DE38B|nr:M90 family metallopeptidase [Pseudomaricurvus sp. HS19]MYM64466.1 protein mtfA [Pseudomaricurvus sp. HS19]